jgi:hypothetical protein
LSDPKAEYFRRGLLLMKAVRVFERGSEDAGVIRQAGGLTLCRAHPDLVRRDLARYADVLKWDQRQGCYCPADLSTVCAKTFLAAAPELVAFPIVRGIASVPIVRNDGTISEVDGYDARSQFIFDTAGVDFTGLQIPAAPTSSDVAAAMSVLKEPLQDFAFVSAADRSVVLSAILSSVARPTLGTCPLHGFSAPSFGAGKTLLCEIVSEISTGMRITTIAPGHSQEELEKRIDSLVLAGDPLVCLDNISEPLGGNNLCALLTSGSARVRILGCSDVVSVASSTLWLATGANLTMRGDMVRRSVVARLDPNVENPEYRKDFAIPDLLGWVHRNRIRLLSAAYTILRSHAIAGHPCPISPLGSFDDWSIRIRGALCWAGEADPVETQASIAAEDPIATTRALVFESIFAVKNTEVWTCTELAQIVARVKDNNLSSTASDSAMAEALAMACRNGRFDVHSLSYFFRSSRDVICGGYKLVREPGDTHDHKARYRIAPAKATEGFKNRVRTRVGCEISSSY